MDFVVKNTEKTDEKMRKQESKFKQLEALTTGMINPIKNCSIKPNHWKAKHGLGRESMCFGFTTEAGTRFTHGGKMLPGYQPGCRERAGYSLPQEHTERCSSYGHPTPARQSQGPAAQARSPSLFHSCSSFFCSSLRTRRNLLRLTRAWGNSHLTSQTTLALEGSTASQTHLPAKRRPGIAKKPEVKPNIWTSIFLNSIFFII